MRRWMVVGVMILAACAATEQGSLMTDARAPDAPIDVGSVDAPRAIDASVLDAARDASTADGCAGNVELCNGVDDNCNGQVDEGFVLGAACTAGMGACLRSGVTMCAEGGASTTCSVQPGQAGPELCGNGIDDDCDGTPDDGFEAVGRACSAGVGACRRDGAFVCSPDKLTLACSVTAGTPTAELCGNGIDEDCDGTPDDGFQNVGLPCTVGVGACAVTSTYACTADRKGIVCNAVPLPPGIELCGNQIDDDCDRATDEGFDVGTECDGPDSDLCLEGVKVCSSDRLFTTCNDFTGSLEDLCDGVDNDCNPATPDGADEGVIEIPTRCDGVGDQDSCAEGYFFCASNGTIQCSDPVDDDLSNDPDNCNACDFRCTNAHGGVACVGGICTPSCEHGFQDCDGEPWDGCETGRLNSTGCDQPIDMGSIDGDETGDSETASGFGEAWYSILVLDTGGFPGDLNAKISLTNPPNVRFGIQARCSTCTSDKIKTVEPDQNATGVVYFGSSDTIGAEDEFHVKIRVYYISGDVSSCGNWTLDVAGTEDVSDRTCDGGDNG